MSATYHIHADDIIVDSDVHFTIDTITRVISNRNGDKANEKLILTQYDNNSERYSFDIDRIVEGHDLLNCNRVQIHYVNISPNKNTKPNIGLYLVDDISVHETNPDKVTFSWLVSRNATLLNGVLNFLVSFECVDGDKVLYRWSTTTFEGIRITVGMDNDNAILEHYIDELLVWQKSMETEVLPLLVDECYIEREFATSEEVRHIFDIYDPAEDEMVGIDPIPTDGSNNLVTSGGVKQYADNLASTKADKATTYTKDEVDGLIDSVDVTYDDSELRESIVELQNGKADKISTYTKDEVDGMLDNVQVDLSDYYTKSEIYNKDEIDNIVDNVQVDLSDYYTKSETYSKKEVNELVDNVEVDLSDYVTNSDLEGKGYLTETELTNKGYATTSSVDAVKDDVSDLTTYVTQDMEYIKKVTVADDLMVLTRHDDTNLTVNNYTTAEKQKLAGLSNYDDSSIKQSITDIQNNKADKSEIPDVSGKADKSELDNKVDKDEWNSYNAANTFKVINNVSDVPIADAANEGKMIFYLGANSTTPYILSYGHYYKCNYVNSTYEWTDITQDPSLEGVANGIREINNNQTIQVWVGTKEELEDEATQPNVAYVPVDVDIKETFDEVLTEMAEDNSGVLQINGGEIISRKKMIYENAEGTYELNIENVSFFDKKLEIVYGMHEAFTLNNESLCFKIIQLITRSKKCVFDGNWSVGINSSGTQIAIMGITITVDGNKISIITKDNLSSINLIKIYKVYEIIE